MDTRLDKEQAVRRTYERLQRTLNFLCRRYEIPADSTTLEAVQDDIGEYADAEIALHTHELNQKVNRLTPIKDEQMEAAHDIIDAVDDRSFSEILDEQMLKSESWGL